MFSKLYNSGVFRSFTARHTSSHALPEHESDLR
jgi:hypothetical protein